MNKLANHRPHKSTNQGFKYQPIAIYIGNSVSSLRYQYDISHIILVGIEAHIADFNGDINDIDTKNH